MSKIQAHNQTIPRLLSLTILIFSLFMLITPTLAQDAQLILDVNIVDPTSGPIETGQFVEYVIDFSCASIIGPCGDLDIDFPIDTELELIEVIAPPGYIGSFSGTPPNIVVNIINDPVSNPTFDDGEAAQVTVRARAGQDIDDSVIDTEVTGTIDNGGGPVTIITDTPSLPISTPSGGWDVTKTITSPSGGLGPAVDGVADYQIAVCPTTTLGVARLTQLVFSDRFPIGATVQSSSVPFVLEDQLPQPVVDGVDDTIVWTIDFTPEHTVEDGCVNVTYSLAFPDADFDPGDDISNNAFVSATTLDDPFPDNVGLCPTDCVGGDGSSGTVDNPSSTPDTDKTGPGTAIVSPGVSNGTSTFSLSWDLSQSNVDTSGVTITDTFPVADSDGLPITEISEIRTATWAGGYQAVLEYTTVGNATFTPIATVDGSSATTFTSPSIPAVPPATTDLITAIRWRFIDDLPPGFTTTANAQVRFFIRAGMAADDYILAPNSYRDYANCIVMNGTFLDENGVSQPIPTSTDCTLLRISDDPAGITNIRTSKSRDKSAVFPLEDIQFTLTLQITQEASGDLLNPAIEDILPFGMQITSWDDVSFSANIPGGEQVLPYLRLDDVDVGGERRQRLLFYWDDTVTGADGDTLFTTPTYAPTYAPISYACSGSPCQTVSTPTFPTYDYSPQAGTTPVAGNPLTMTPPATGVKTINIRFTAQPRLDAIAGDDDGNLVPSTNTTTVVTDSTVLSCQSGTESSEGAFDVDDDGITGEVTCETSASFQIREAAQMASQKWIRDQAITPTLPFVDSENLSNPSPTCPAFNYDPSSTPPATVVTYTRFPCVAQGLAGGAFEYLLRVQNTGLVNTDNYILYDVLPHIGDTGVSEALSGDARLTEFRVEMTGPVVEEDVPPGFTYIVEYNTDPSYNGCRPEMSDDADETGWQGACDNTWVTAATIGANWDTVTAFRIVQTGGVIPSGDEMIFTVPMLIDGTPGEAETGEISWNSFAQRFNNQPSGRRLLTAEPRKVGIIVEEVYSIGNRVWIDDGIGGGIANNGIIDGAEIGVNGVTVELYQGGVLFATDVTRRDLGPNGVDDGGGGDDGLDGYYFFGNLPAGTYYVQVAGSEFAGGGDLSGYISSTGNQDASVDNNVDSIDTGIDQADQANYVANGVRSDDFTLTRNSEATGETDVNDDNAGTDPEPPTNEGVLGRGENFEEDADSDLTVDFGFFLPMSIGNRVWFDPNNNGVIDPTEEGVNGVIVELFRDNGSGINPATDTPYRTTITNSDTINGGDGYYIFDGLPQGDYIVRLSPDNFIPDDLGTGVVEGTLTDGTGLPLSSSESGSAPQSTYLLDNQTDNNDNGIDGNFPQTDGIVSNIINLTYDAEPDGAVDDTPDLDADVGEGTFGELDRNADMTVDFGFYPPAMSLGNRVFKDFNNDRIFNGADVGVDGVVVNLFRDTDQDGVPDSGITNPIATTTTDNGGYYIFDGLVAGFYLVQIDEENFRTTGNGTLLDFYSSQDKDAANNPVPPTDNEDDTIENGIDNPFSLDTNPDPQAQGVFSPTVELVPSNEVATEADLGPEGDGEPNIQASNSDLTIDFGFYQPMSIGNVVWFDTVQDGLFNNTEAGIAGVTVELYLDDGNGVFDAGDTLVPVFDGTGYVNFDTTDANGFYLFDNLPPGQYFVHIPVSNFVAGNSLFNHISTVPNNEANPSIAPAPSIDSNDNGTPDDTTAITVGITSELVTLGVIDPNGSGLYIPNNSEPTNEINKSNNPPTPASTYDGPASIGRYGELDNNSDITIDFGFILQDDSSMSIGNRVWFDTNRNGLVDDAGDDNPAATGNPGIDDVLVLLYRADASGNPIGDPIARDITANGGYYLFDVLDTDALTAVGDGDGLGGPVTPGNYVVSVAPSNFAGGGPLENYTSTDTSIDNDGTLPPSTAVEGTYGAIDDDNNDNGTSDPTYGVLSNPVTLVLQNERDDEDVANKEAGVLDGTDSGGNPIAFNNSDLTIDFGFHQPLSLGNFVWFDTNNDGLYDDTTEIPVPDGVTLTLYLSDGTTTVDEPGNPGNPYQVTTTDGFYLFENLPPNDYIVKVDQANFLPAGLLEGYLGSDDQGNGFEDDTDDDLNDNGRDVDPTIDGIPSGIITLDYNTEPTGEAVSGNPADGPDGRGNNGELDENSNLTVDFGVYPSTFYSIGNRVWEDTGAGANENNGVHDSDEAGIEDVVMLLFRDEDDGSGGGPDGIPDSTTPVATTNTDADGYYVFDSLPSGNYIVSIAPSNFDAGGALRGYSPTAQADPSDDDANDDDDNVTDQTNTIPDPDFGIFSATYTLESNTEPTGEADPTPAGTAQDPGVDPFGVPIPDDQSNLTVDFGFIRTLSLGNLVWFDIDNDGEYDDDDEVGIADVTVEIYLDDGDGTFDETVDTLIDTDVTDGNGFYLFNDLDPGDYFVHIPNDPNWTGAGSTPLVGFQSSGPDASSPDTDDDNDNGLGTGDTNPTPGVTSELLTLEFGDAPTGESTLSNNPDDGPEFRGVNNPPDNNSDLTWDFGFFLGDPMSIGNIVWIDDGNTTGTANNGIRDGDELGVDGVEVELYADSDGDGVPDTSSPIDSTTTDDGGYYLFDGLPPGQYVVVITEDNFDGGVLDGFLSTTDGTPDNDDEDQGIDNPTPSNGGVSSDTIVLEVGTEPSPTAATDDSEDVTGTGENGETDENSNLTVDFGFVTAYDWGDAPDTYGTDNDILTTVSPTVDSSDEIGPSHRIIANLYLGELIDDETNGAPVPTGTSNNTNDPDGDGADGGFDEDGMAPPEFVAGTTVTVDITAFNDTGDDATLIVWFDWDGNGVFDDSEAYTADVPDGTDGVIQIEVDVPDTAEDDTGGNTYARLRLTTDDITTSEPTGPKDSGEVEDYYIQVRDPGLLINKTDGLNSIVAGEVNTYTIVIENSGDPRTGVRFFDEIPLATATDANGYDPETVEWICEAENGASCIANAASGTGSSGGPFLATDTSVVIDELIDLPRDGRITYTVTAQVNENAGLIPPNNTNPIINLAQLPNELPPLEEEDETFIIFDPPFGVKTGRVTGNNIIRWTMTWYNPGQTQPDVTITDELGSGQEFPDTAAEIDLQCSGSNGSCSIVGDDTVEWTGTMLTSTPDDDDEAVVISFNVVVDGDGRYRNRATLNAPGVDETVSDTVTIRDREEVPDEEDVADGGFTQTAPQLTKVVDTPFTLPGATVVWTIEATNDTDQTINNVTITDNVPAPLTITDGTSSSGDLTIDGQTVTVKQDSFAPGEVITITLTTDVSDSVEIPFVINNPALLQCDCSEDRNAIASIISVLELPATGETPWWRIPLLISMMFGGLLIVVSPMVIIKRRKNKNS